MPPVETRLSAKDADSLVSLLNSLYSEQLSILPDDSYLREHADPAFVAGAVSVFRFYEPWLPVAGRILDWGCRHAPDACLIRSRRGDSVQLAGCDVVGPEQYQVFHSFAGLQYQRILDTVRLPWSDGEFDAVISSGVLEHVAMDYESLKELYRVLKPEGLVVITYLPNAHSVEEWLLRRRHGPGHQRLYRLGEFQSMLLHTGFLPLRIGYQTSLDLLPPPAGPSRWIRRLQRLALLHRITSCLCAVARKVDGF